MKPLYQILAIAVLLAVGTPPVRAEPGARHALILCGLAGDAAHRVLFASTVEQLHRGLTSHHDFLPENVMLLWSEPQTDQDGSAIATNRGPASREEVSAVAAELQKTLQPDDALWVIALGHAHYDGRNSWLNLPGPDMSNSEFAALFAEIRCQEQVFFLTTAASGFFIKPLSLPGRIVIAATEADREFNETIFPHKLATALADPPPFVDMDIDNDGRLSLLDLYLWSTRETAQEYATNMLLATEHARLDDNGDGRGTEIQADILSEELGGRPPSRRKPPPTADRDGALARRLILRYPPSPPSAAANRD
jgi:hypothetical protein